jgi:hypothetical protein
MIIFQAYIAASAGGGKHVLQKTSENFPHVKINGYGEMGIKQSGCSSLV